MALVAGGVAIPDELKAALQGPTMKARKNVAGTYSGLQSRLDQDRATLGHEPGDATNPADYTLAQGAASGQRQVNDTLASALGGTAYQDQLGQREYDQNAELARQIADLQAPGTLEQIFSGMGGAAKLGGMGYGMFRKKGTGGTGTSDEDLAKLMGERGIAPAENPGGMF